MQMYIWNQVCIIYNIQHRSENKTTLKIPSKHHWEWLLLPAWITVWAGFGWHQGQFNWLHYTWYSKINQSQMEVWRVKNGICCRSENKFTPQQTNAHTHTHIIIILNSRKRRRASVPQQGRGQSVTMETWVQKGEWLLQKTNRILQKKNTEEYTKNKQTNKRDSYKIFVGSLQVLRLYT